MNKAFWVNIIIFFLVIILITGIFLGFTINLVQGEFSLRLLRIVLVNTFFLSLGVILNLILTRLFIVKMNQIVIFFLSFFIITGMTLIGLVIAFLEEPLFLLLQINTVYSYLVIHFLLVLSFTVITTGFVIYHESILRQEKIILQEKELRGQIEKKLYTSKINPHFLFNTLNLLISLLNKPQIAEKALVALSDLLRYNLKAYDNDLIIIDEEIHNIEKYLFIQKLRFEERLDYHINITAHKMIPPFIIQPLIENSIQHNINQADKLIIDIDILQEKTHFIIRIYDNCRKLKPVMAGLGTGLTNSMKRVELSGGQFTIKDGGIEIIYKL